MAKAEEARAGGRSFDVGLMQVNNWWLKKYDISLEAALDPAANVYFGAWILKEELRRHGSLRAAVGAYHSPTAFRANRYADQVMAALEGKTPKKSASKTRQIKQASKSSQHSKYRNAKVVTNSNHRTQQGIGHPRRHEGVKHRSGKFYEGREMI